MIDNRQGFLNTNILSIYSQTPALIASFWFHNTTFCCVILGGIYQLLKLYLTPVRGNCFMIPFLRYINIENCKSNAFSKSIEYNLETNLIHNFW